MGRFSNDGRYSIIRSDKPQPRRKTSGSIPEISSVRKSSVLGPS